MRLPERLTARPRRPLSTRRVHGFLEHALFVAHDDIGRAQFHEPFEPVVAVDDAPVEVVEVAGGEAAAVELDHGAQLGRDDRQGGEHHPFGPVAGLAEILHDAQAFGGLLAPLFGLGGAHLPAQFVGHGVQVELGDDVADCFGAHAGGEDVAPALGELPVAVFGEELFLLQGFQVVQGALHLGAQAILLGFHLAADIVELGFPFPAHEVALGADAHADVGLLLVGLALEGVEPLLDQVVDQGIVLLGDDLPGAEQGLVGPGEELILRGFLPAWVWSQVWSCWASAMTAEVCSLMWSLSRAISPLSSVSSVPSSPSRWPSRVSTCSWISASMRCWRMVKLPLVALDGAGAGVFVDVGDDELGEVEDALQVAGADVEQQAQPGGDALDVPDMAHGGGEFDVAHAFTADAGGGDFHAALVADDAFVADALVFAAGALPVPCGAEDAFAEEPIAFRPEGAVVDGLGFGDFAVGPLPNLFGGGQRDADGVEIAYFHCVLFSAKSLVRGTWCVLRAHAPRTTQHGLTAPNHCSTWSWRRAR